MKTLVLKPVIYSKAKNVGAITKKLLKDPKQVCNTPAAFKGLVMEFILATGPDYGQPVGSLDEYYTQYKANRFILVDRQQELIYVKRTSEGNFIRVDLL